MGVIILTNDETSYKVGKYIETRKIEYPPSAPKTTYIIHCDRITEKEIKRWMNVVSYRMVFVVKKLPTISQQTKEEIINHK